MPVINELSKGGYPADAINCIIMSPTRELAQQIDQQMEGFSYFMPVSSVAIYGGNDGIRFEQEKKGLTLGADVVIATPGRLISHLSLGYVDLSKVSFFILDEADRMLDMGFADDIMQIVKYLPKKRQTIMFSATARIGHKTGTSDRNVQGELIGINDVGFILLPDGKRYTIAVLVKDSTESMADTEKIIANISGIVYHHLVSEKNISNK